MVEQGFGKQPRNPARFAKDVFRPCDRRYCVWSAPIALHNRATPGHNAWGSLIGTRPGGILQTPAQWPFAALTPTIPADPLKRLQENP